MDDNEATEADRTSLEAALGRMVYMAATVEMVVEVTGSLMAVGEAETEALMGNTIGPLAKLTLRYAERASHLDATMLAALESILADVKVGMDNRNAYVHGSWGTIDGALVAMNSKGFTKVPGGFRIKPLSMQHLDQLTAELEELRERMLVWCNRSFDLQRPDLVAKIEGLEPDDAPPYPAPAV
ncbi:hypothetical protein [Streptomyces sp. NBC_00094]|uniref:hypothetical protein n=1 Tax=Streptomyces sp. NBC_00094 TaxID=2903620 RepID=UPI002256F695|nr:hypothetical protein [Streptomyces sp. NBC_00094]MCX5391532.1 hypothetical protein [Streptomyces sp. NBC_00094]